MSPEEYLSLMEEVEDAKLLRLAESRLQNFTPAETIPAEDVYQLAEKRAAKNNL